MSERIDIINQSLTWLGANSITGLTDDSDEARLVQLNYVLCRDATLESFEWSFAIKRFTPALDAASPDHGFTKQYRVPADIMRIVWVGDDMDTRWWRDRPQFEYTVESSGGDQELYILTDDEPIACIGIRRIENEGIYSALFAEAFAARLATVMALPLTQSNTIMQNMAAMFDSFIQTAKSRDGLQGVNRRLTTNNMKRARQRFGGFGAGWRW